MRISSRKGRWEQLRHDLSQLVEMRDERHGDGVNLRCEYLLLAAKRT